MVLQLAGRPSLGVGGSDPLVCCGFGSDRCHRGGLEKTIVAGCGAATWLIVSLLILALDDRGVELVIKKLKCKSHWEKLNILC